MEDLRSAKKIVVLTRNAPTTYYEDKNDTLAGLDYELAQSFAAFLRIKIEFKVLETTGEIIQAIRDGKGDFAAAGLTKTNKRRKEFFIGPPLQTIQQQVICNKKQKIEKLRHLRKIKLTIIANSSYHERMKRIARSVKKLKYEVVNDLSSEEVLEAVSQGKIDCTVADSNILAIHQRYFPNLNVVYSLGKPQQLVWIFPKTHKFLKKELYRWFSQVQKNSELSATLDRYYSHTDTFNYTDTTIFKRKIKKTLPKYIKLFKEASKKYNIPWKLLAALSYQESHWNPRAKSPTGVRGIMMLTQATAREVKVKNRMDPRQSIMGGAKYLKKVINRIPSYITGNDRLWMALASYNIGYAHLRDARSLAVQKEKHPNLWAGVKDVFPLLSKKRYYRRLPHGYARGWEPVKYVKRIRNYLEILNESSITEHQ